MKKQSNRSAEPTRRIVMRGLQGVPNEIKAELPSNNLLTRTIQRSRFRNNPQLMTPATRGELIIPDYYTKTFEDKDFLFHDSGGDSKRFLVFTTTENLEYLASCETWHCDGTFDTTPRIFQQIYTIHGVKNNKTTPLVFALLPNKTKSMYNKFLSVLKNNQENLNPNTIITDFEQAFISAAGEIFVQSNLHGCNFHLGQSMYRHLQSEGLVTLYGNDLEFSQCIRMLLALAYVPPDDVRRTYKLLIKSELFVGYKEQLGKIIEYFERTWVGDRNRRGSRPPLFPIEMWNCYDATINDNARTNNPAEAWHRAFSATLQETHTSMGRLIDALRHEQTLVETILSHDEAGRQSPAKRRKKYRDYDQRLKNLVLSYDHSIDVIRYVKGIATNIKI